MSHISMSDVESYIQASKGVLDIAKTMIGMLPKGQQHDDAEVRLEQAHKALRAAEVQLAKSLGYHLCQCTFPPQIMLSKGRHPEHNEEIFTCGNCNKQNPSEGHFRAIDKMRADAKRQTSNYF
jgi:hypothetical protein